ncbi:hypothetical protein MLD38_030998 [Melastoma candidum]|uniref:Uncharacterized protein n=1 Tax=Melastoma candidum TaxID=119954 RepID=A0ACB9MPL7_9MYRT|nr:hypothetical protein MLD38_030998 [Melastoma candidum]
MSSSSTHIESFIVPTVVVMFCFWTASSSSVVESLPGFGSLPFRLETGYVGVDYDNDVQLFYYFVESEGNPGKDPLLLWLTGGPGCSGISGLLYEIGPLRFVKAVYNGTIPSLVPNPYSWTKVSSIIFVDAPVGTGFSYAKNPEGYETGDMTYARHCHDFLKKWLLDHPRFIGHSVYVAGDSYSGMIVPLIAQYILQESDDFMHEAPINLKGYLLGNPATDPDSDESSKLTFAYHGALIPKDLYECTDLVNHAHILEPKCIGFSPQRSGLLEDGRKHQEEIPELRCRSYVNVLCHVYVNDPIVVFTSERLCGFGPGLDVTEAYPTPMMLPALGDQDMVIPYLGTQSWIESMDLPVIEEWRPWKVDDEVAGYVRSYENHLTFATVKGGGHTAPEYLPKSCFLMFRRWISGESI